jgi:hypothetical protein
MKMHSYTRQTDKRFWSLGFYTSYSLRNGHSDPLMFHYFTEHTTAKTTELEIMLGTSKTIRKHHYKSNDSIYAHHIRSPLLKKQKSYQFNYKYYRFKRSCHWSSYSWFFQNCSRHLTSHIMNKFMQRKIFKGTFIWYNYLTIIQDHVIFYVFLLLLNLLVIQLLKYKEHNY